ncbi:MAG TPA: AAA family ATPase [Candidatus Paceibacterota bacterium]
MAIDIDYKKMATSWTKFDIVQALDVVYSVETIQRFKNKEANIDEPILKSFLGIKSLQDPIPDYWIEIQKYPNEKKIFALLALIFTHGSVVEDFATIYSKGNMKGVFVLSEQNKQLTNIRSALIVSEASEPIYRRQKYVPYDFSVAIYNPNVGQLFKRVIQERLSRLTSEKLSEENFYQICYANKFDKALSLTKIQFRTWLEGEVFDAHYINSININSFFSIKEPLKINFGNSKEIYFLGENGDGKSLILMALYLAFNGNYIKYKTDKEKTGLAIDFLEKYNKIEGFDEFDHEYNIQNAIYLENFYAYGTHRGRSAYEETEQYGFMSLFSYDLTLKSPIQWLKDLKLNEDSHNLNSKIASSKIEDILFDLLERNVKTKIDGSKVTFIEKGCELTLDELSEGYRSVIIFVCDLLYRLCSNEKNQTDIFGSKGVVLIDEIDQHLHLKWQRIIVQKLRSLFPNIQFFFTTHSPTIIQGASDDAIIFRVYRENGVTKVSDPYYRKDLDHLMMNTIVTSSLFGLDDSRMNSNDLLSKTDDTYLLYRINKKIEDKLNAQKALGKSFISDSEIDNLIDKIINENLRHDKD